MGYVYTGNVSRNDEEKKRRVRCEKGGEKNVRNTHSRYNHVMKVLHCNELCKQLCVSRLVVCRGDGIIRWPRSRKNMHLQSHS
jgi:hypothetical protein